MNPFHNEDPALDEAIASAFADLASAHADEEKHRDIVQQLTELYKLKHDTAKIALEFHQSETKHKLEEDQWSHQLATEALPWYKRVSPDTVVTVFGNILIGVVVVKYEQTGVISSKVMSFMKKI